MAAKDLVIVPPEVRHPGKYLSSGALISGDGKYRWRLWREWRGTHDPKNWVWFGGKDGAGRKIGHPKSVVFVMLNPSTADGEKDDPTIRRCVAFAKSWNYERIEVVNLFAFRATRPSELLALNHKSDPVGWENQQHVESAVCDDALIICAWGEHGSHIGQDETMLGWLAHKETYALGLTAAGHPRHPLYLKSDAKPIPFKGRGEKR